MDALVQYRCWKTWKLNFSETEFPPLAGKDKINWPKDKINWPKDKINWPKDKINWPKDKINWPKDKIN